MVASLPQSLYRSDQVRDGERKIAADLGVKMYSLMEKAGAATFNLVKKRWPDAKRILVCCGGGNNGGDGYVIAKLALEAGLSPTVWSVVDPADLSGDAHFAWQKYVAAGGRITQAPGALDAYDLIVDALLGTGLSRHLAGSFLEAVEAINAAACPVISVDLPSGLDADTGAVLGAAIDADCTVSVVALKQGLFTGRARAHCGVIIYDGLGIGTAFAATFSPSALRLDLAAAAMLEPERNAAAHKGIAGKVLCIGGQRGMGGAIILCGQAALRSGAGLVAVLTDPSHIPALLASQPELMTRWWEESQSMDALNAELHWADVIAIGPGLGKREWAQQLFCAAVQANKPMVVDADALNLLAQAPKYYDGWVLTPHPGEAAHLLGVSMAEIEHDRFFAVKEIQRRYGGVVVLKGAGTIVYDGSIFAVVDAGNPGMASGGMGDVLTGVIAGCIAQTRSLSQSALFGSYLHSFAADHAAKQGVRGLVASDLLPLIGKNIKQLQQ